MTDQRSPLAELEALRQRKEQLRFQRGIVDSEIYSIDDKINKLILRLPDLSVTDPVDVNDMIKLRNASNGPERSRLNDDRIDEMFRTAKKEGHPP